jgi:hypothetical protein
MMGVVDGGKGHRLLTGGPGVGTAEGGERGGFGGWGEKAVGGYKPPGLRVCAW